MPKRNAHRNTRIKGGQIYIEQYKKILIFNVEFRFIVFKFNYIRTSKKTLHLFKIRAIINFF